MNCIDYFKVAVLGSDSIDFDPIDSAVINQYGGYTVGLGHGVFEREFFLKKQ